MSNPPLAATSAAAVCQTELAELRLLADESAVFYTDAASAAGKGTALGMLFARLARAKLSLAKAIPASSKPGASSGAGAAARLRGICNDLRARKGAAGESYAAKMQAVESNQLKAVLEFLDRDIPMPVRERARPFLRAMHQHQDLIDHTMARRAMPAAG